MTSYTGVTSSAEMVLNASPRIPSNLDATNEAPWRVVISPKVTLGMAIPPHVTVSSLRCPLTPPLPYWMSRAYPFFLYVDELVDL